MLRSIARRLALMFAATGFLVFGLSGVVLNSLLRDELERHERTELDSRTTVFVPLLTSTTDPTRWPMVLAKLEAAMPAEGAARFWMLSDDPRLRYGDQQIAQQVAQQGRCTIPLNGEEVPMKAQTNTIPANGERAVLKLVIALDQRPYRRTLRAFTIALIGASGAGMLLVALLGHWIARLGLRPLERLSREAQSLSPSRLSQRLAQSNLAPELAQLTGSFNGALDRLESAYQQLEAFNADVAHELRTPVTNLIGQTQVALSRDRDAATLQEVLQSNLEELERLRTIINDMLFLARADQGATANARVPTALAQDVAKAVDYLDVVLDEAGVRVRVEGDASASVERSLLGRALTNLLLNAVQHSERGSEIVARIEGEAGQVRVAISNHGQDIVGDHLERLFDRFYRADDARRGSHLNHGLGLAIVKAIATMHGGRVFATSRNGVNTFGFSLPAGC